MRRDAKHEPQAFWAFRPADNSPFSRHFTNAFLLLNEYTISHIFLKVNNFRCSLTFLTKFSEAVEIFMYIYSEIIYFKEKIIPDSLNKFMKYVII